MIVVFATDTEEFGNNRILEHDFSKMFFGTEFLPCLKDMLKELGVSLITGDVALKGVESQMIDPKSICLISEFHSEQGNLLISKGAVPLISYSLESPAVAYRYYDDILKDKFLYKHYIGLAPVYPKKIKNFIEVHFPSIGKEDLQGSIDRLASRVLEQPAKVGIVASNKMFNFVPEFIWYKNPVNHAKQITNYFNFFFSKSRRVYKDYSLHLKRFRTLEILANEGMVEVAGTGWDREENYPFKFKHLKELLNNHLHGRVKSKYEFLGRFKFVLAVENTEVPSYETEKLFQALISGSTPLYLGNIKDGEGAIPRDCFIDLYSEPLEKLPQLLRKISDSERQGIRNRIVGYLKKYGYLYTHEYFAEVFYELIKKRCL